MIEGGMRMVEDKEVLNAVDSKEALLDELIHLYGDDLKRTAFMYVNDLSQSEDIIQEVFISCYKNLNNFRQKSSYKTWLYRITINKCKDYQRKWSFRNIVYKPIVEPIKNQFAESPQQVYEKQEDSNELISVIASLPHKYKEVLILFYYQQMTMKEISEVSGLKMNTVKSRLSRGKTMLKDELERRDIYHE